MRPLLTAIADFFEPLIAQWRALKPGSRFFLVLSGVLVFAGVWTFREAMANRAYRPLYSELSAEEAGAAVSRLQALQVPYKLAANGSTILVPESRLAETRLQLASDGFPRTGRLGFELFDSVNFGATEFAEQVNFRRALEGELERSVLSLTEVEKVRVHISLPKRSVFLDYEQAAKASVVMQLRRAAQLTQEQINAISFLIASAVEGLDSANVVVVDTAGRVLAKPRPQDSELTTEQLEYQRRIEAGITKRILETLEPYVGFDKVRASVTAVCDWNGGEQTEELIDPNGVVTSTQKSQEVSQPVTENGLPGTASNLPRQPVAPRTAATSHTRSMETTNYQASRTVTRMKLERGSIERLSVAVLVDQKMQLDEATGKMVRVPRTGQEMETIRQLVVAAAGIVEERGDRLTTENLPFTIFEPPPAIPEAVEIPAPLFSTEWLEKYRYYLIVSVSVLLLALVAVWGFLRLRKKIARMRVEQQAALEAEKEKREIDAAKDEARRRELEEQKMLQGLKMATVQSSKGQVLRKHLEEAAAQDTESFVQLLRTWIHEDD